MLLLLLPLILMTLLRKNFAPFLFGSNSKISIFLHLPKNLLLRSVSGFSFGRSWCQNCVFVRLYSDDYVLLSKESFFFFFFWACVVNSGSVGGRPKCEYFELWNVLSCDQLTEFWKWDHFLGVLFHNLYEIVWVKKLGNWKSMDVLGEASRFLSWLSHPFGGIFCDLTKCWNFGTVICRELVALGKTKKSWNIYFCRHPPLASYNIQLHRNRLINQAAFSFSNPVFRRLIW